MNLVGIEGESDTLFPFQIDSTCVNTIPILDLQRQYKTIGSEINAAVQAVVASGRYIGGPAVSEFEAQFATYTGTTDCVSCNSGTDALYLALRALEIGPGDQVITSPFTFIATAEVISMVGATPVFVDIDAETFNLDLEKVAGAITEQTRAIMPVHLFGQPVDMTRLLAIAEAHNLAVIEDCAQATGATWAGKKVGSFGHFGCFSFYPTKNLGAAGDGGAVTTNDPALAAKMRVLRNHGQSSTYHYEAVGMNSRLDALQAAILQVKLPYLDTWNSQRAQVADRYQQLLAGVTGVIPPVASSAGQSVWNQYTVRIPVSSSEHNRRDRAQTHLQQQGIGSMIYYPLPLHLQPVYRSLGYQPGQLPVAEQVAQEVLSLPMFPELLPEEQEQVVLSLQDSLIAYSEARM